MTCKSNILFFVENSWVWQDILDIALPAEIYIKADFQTSECFTETDPLRPV